MIKPEEGDDFYLRSNIKGYDMNARKKEIKEISHLLEQGSCNFKFDEIVFNWEYYNSDLDKILAALSIVSFGNRELLSERDYNFSIDFLRTKQKDNRLSLSQIWCIWEAIKK